MRLYRTAAGLFAGTQADAGPSATKIDWPDDKPGTINALNALITTPRAADAEPVAITSNAPPPVQPVPSRSAAGGFTLTDAEAFIQSADAHQIRSLFENVVFRGRELIAEARA